MKLDPNLICQTLDLDSDSGDDDDEDVDVVSFVKIEKERVTAALLHLEDLGPDDEVWTLTVPKHVSAHFCKITVKTNKAKTDFSFSLHFFKCLKFIYLN